MHRLNNREMGRARNGCAQLMAKMIAVARSASDAILEICRSGHQGE